MELIEPTYSIFKKRFSILTLLQNVLQILYYDTTNVCHIIE